jgi:hypothetical protein
MAENRGRRGSVAILSKLDAIVAEVGVSIVQ